MNRLDRRADELSQRYPHYKTYAACQSKAFMTGSATLALVGGTTFAAMEAWFHHKRPNISKNWMVAVPILVGIATAYVVTMRQTSHCQHMWMAMEERHSVLTPAEERLAERTRTTS